MAHAASGASRCSTGGYSQRLDGASVRRDRFHNVEHFSHCLSARTRSACGRHPLVFLHSFITLFPHWNVRTPNWVGYFIQRPEEHILHHQREVHAGNYSDWPLWDKVFGTYRAPVEEPVQVGFLRELDLRSSSRCSRLSTSMRQVTSMGGVSKVHPERAACPREMEITLLRHFDQTLWSVGVRNSIFRCRRLKSLPTFQKYNLQEILKQRFLE